MKYSALVPIRSRNEVYTPFSGIKSRKLVHKRVQSEIPTNTMAMGVQCDSMKLLDSVPQTHTILIPDIKMSPTNEISSSEPRNSAGQSRKSSKLLLPDENDAPKIEIFHYSEEKNKEKDESQIFYKRIEFAKIGDWNETYILKSKNNSFCKQPSSSNNSKNFFRKPCKITEFNTEIINKPKPKFEQGLPWQFKPSERGIFNVSVMLRLQKRYKINNIKY